MYPGSTLEQSLDKDKNDVQKLSQYCSDLMEVEDPDIMLGSERMAETPRAPIPESPRYGPTPPQGSPRYSPKYSPQYSPQYSPRYSPQYSPRYFKE